MSRIKIESLRKIPIKEICQDGWLKRIGNLQIMLRHQAEGICSFVDGVEQQQVLWKVYERTIGGNISYRGGFIPTDKAWDWYVYGRDGKRYALAARPSKAIGRAQMQAGILLGKTRSQVVNEIHSSAHKITIARKLRHQNSGASRNHRFDICNLEGRSR
jgi:hypothetical protein